MSFPDLATPQLEQRGRNFNVTHGSDDHAFVTFDDRPIQNDQKSLEAGHPVFINQLFVTIDFPGDKTKRIDRPATDLDFARWPAAYQRYQSKTETAVDGWRLEDWAVLTRADVENLKQYKIYTVEQLASISDANVTGLGLGVVTFKAKAVAALQQAADGSALPRLVSENERLTLEVNRLKSQVNELAALAERPAQSLDIEAMVAKAIAEQMGKKRVA